MVNSAHIFLGVIALVRSKGNWSVSWDKAKFTKIHIHNICYNNSKQEKAKEIPRTLPIPQIFSEKNTWILPKPQLFSWKMPGSHWIKAVREKSHIRPSVSPRYDRHTWILFDQDTVILEINRSCWIQAQFTISTHRWGCTGCRYYLQETPSIYRHLVRKLMPQIFGHVNISVIFLGEHMGPRQHRSLIRFAWITQGRSVLPWCFRFVVCICKEKCKKRIQPLWFSLVSSKQQPHHNRNVPGLLKACKLREKKTLYL